MFNFAAAHEAAIIAGLQASENISSRVLDLCLKLVLRLFVLTRVVLQIFFDFFAIEFNMRYTNIIGHVI